MTVHIHEMTTTVDAVATTAPAAAGQPQPDSAADRERARRAADRAARIRRRTHAEGFDD